MRRWLGRHRTLVTGTAAALVVGLVSLIASTALLSAANDELSRKQSELQQANSNLEQKTRALEVANHDISTANQTISRNNVELTDQRALSLQTLRLVLDEIDGKLKTRAGVQDVAAKRC